jgi:hypothetical protein
MTITAANVDIVCPSTPTIFSISSPPLQLTRRSSRDWLDTVLAKETRAVAAHEVGRQGWQPLVMVFREAVFDGEVGPST